MIAEAEYTALLTDLYAGVAEPERFRAFLQRLGAASGSHITALITQHADPRSNTLVADGIDPALLARYEAQPAPDDKLWFQRSAPAMHTGAVLNGEDWASPGEIRHTRYYADVLRELDTLHSVALCGLVAPGHAAFLTPCRSARAGAYDAEAMALFRQIGPHWVNAYALMLRFEHLNAQAAQPSRRQRALFLLDHELRWIGGNDAAERMVAAGWWRGRRGSRLDSGSAVTRAAWLAAQRQLAGASPARQRTIPVYDALATLVAFASLRPYGVLAGEDLPSYVLFVRPLQAGNNDEDLTEQLRHVFDLTMAEATLATALRRQGELAQAAAALGITEGSARTRLQSVFEKTAIHRQSDLLRMLDALADTIA